MRSSALAGRVGRENRVTVMMVAKDHGIVAVEAGGLHVRLAETRAEIRASQKLRYRIFCEEMTAKPMIEMAAAKREADSFDEFCDHLLVFDQGSGGGPPAVVGSYRLMRREAAERRGQFYSSDEYDISKLLAYRGGILELGRSCVDRRYRTGATMQLLWRGIADFVLHHKIDVLFGCASLPGLDPEALSAELSFLHHHHLAPPALRPRALAERYVKMDRLPPDAFDRGEVWQALPPLIKGYLRVGGFVGDGAVVDYDFGTTDVCIVVKTDRVTEKYYRHYTREDAAKTQGTA